MFYQTAITMTSLRLKALIVLIDKVQAESHSNGTDESTILDARLAPDMLPFSRQIQIATDNAKGMACRLAGREIPKYDDTEVTLDDLKARLQKTIDYLATFSEIDFVDAATREARFPYFPGVKMVGVGYLLSYAIPNFFFHVVTAYDILRNAGYSVGKVDFMGGQVETLPDVE